MTLVVPDVWSIASARVAGHGDAAMRRLWILYTLAPMGARCCWPDRCQHEQWGTWA